MTIPTRDLEGLAHYACRPWRGSPHYDDLLQEARIGAWRASQKYDPGAGQFSTYAIHHARGRVLHYLRRRSNTITIPNHHDVHEVPPIVDLPENAPLEDIPDPADFTAGVILRSLLDTLPSEHARSLSMYADGYSQREIARALGVSQYTVSRWLTRSALRLGRVITAPMRA